MNKGGGIIGGEGKLNYLPSHPIVLCVSTHKPEINAGPRGLLWTLSPLRPGYLPVCRYLSRMSFLTFVTPLTLRATSTAL